MNAPILLVAVLATASAPLRSGEAGGGPAMPATALEARSAPARVVGPSPVSDNGTSCAPLSRHAVGQRGLGVWRDFDPRAGVDAHLAVDRRIDGCPVPVLAGRR